MRPNSLGVLNMQLHNATAQRMRDAGPLLNLESNK